MTQFKNGGTKNKSPLLKSLLSTSVLVSAAFSLPLTVAAQETTSEVAEEDTRELDTVTVTGIRGSLQNALIEKRNADSLVEVIRAEDIGKLPDQNLAEVLENLTGVQITRTAGVGTGVQIRGETANRVEFNGVGSLGSGASRTGVSFEDINPAIISSVEVVKAPEAKTTEGSIGGTVNLKTIRPLDLQDTLISVRLQGEDSSLSTEDVKPRISGAYGNKWDTGAGEFGIVITGSYTEQEATSFRPRADRDNLVTAPDGTVFQGIQFFIQEQENDDYETINLSGTAEWAPNSDLKLYADVIYLDQERSRDQYRLQASGIAGLRNLPANLPSVFGTADYTAIGGPVLQTAEVGTVEPDLAFDDDDGNLRFSSETGARVTDTSVISLGGEWNRDRWTLKGEAAFSKSETTNPTLNTTLNFINPNCPLDGAPTGDPSTSNDNCVPFIYDLRNESLAFGINFNSPFAPTPEQLLDPANTVLDQLDVGRNRTDNEETALRFDASYDFSDSSWGDFLTSVDAGIRFTDRSHEFEDIDDRIGGFSRLEDSPSGALFSDILVAGPTNYGDGDGRSLFIRNFLLVNPDLSFSDPNRVISAIEAALAAHRANEPQADGDLTLNLSSDQNSFRNIEEQSIGLYAQANFESGMFRGNIGARFISTDVTSTGFGPEDANGVRSLQSTDGSYEFLLPRFNLVAAPTDQLQFRFSYTEDIRRPSFSQLTSGFTLDQSENASVRVPNPSLRPEQVDALDISADWYFAEGAVVSVGYFIKDRTDRAINGFDGALLIDDGMGGFLRETDPTCPGGGVFNPEVIPNVLGDPNTTGLCVDAQTLENDPSTVTQDGWEFAFQYDLGSFEDRLGWASGFGVTANYTVQENEGGGEVRNTSGRGLTVLGPLEVAIPLLDFSETAYNITGYYEKYGISARARYTWRDSFQTNDFAGGANTSGSSTLSLPVHTEARGQLNASITYDVTDNFNIGIEGVNLTESNIVQRCGTLQGAICFVGIPDRRITFGGSYTF